MSVSPLEIHLSPRMGERGYTILFPKENEWKQVIRYVDLFLAFSDETVGRRILVHSNITTTGGRDTIYCEYIITRSANGWTRHVAVFLATEEHPYGFHVNLYMEVEKRRGIWRGFQTSSET